MAKDLRVNIVGDASKLRAELGKADREVSGFASKLGGAGKAIAAGMAVAGGALVAAGAAAYKLGSDFDSAYDAIRVGTGATGDALNALKGDFKAVVKDVPADFASASQAVADLNTRTGATGKPLQELSKRVLELSRLTGTDLAANIAASTRMFGDWSIPTELQAGALDKVFRASQATGIGVDTLQEKIVQFGAPLRQLGFSFEQSAALLGKWEKEGVNVELVLGAMRKSLGTFAKEGKEPIAAFRDIAEQIKNAGSQAKANALAVEVFGSKAGPDMAASIREGRFALDELLAVVEGGGETILGAAADTEDFAEKWLKLKNRVFVALEPVVMRVFDAVTRLLDVLGPKVEAIIARVGPAIGEFLTTLSQIGGALRDGFEFGVTDQGGVLGFFAQVGNVAYQVLEAFRTVGDGVRAVLSALFGKGGSAESDVSAFRESIAPILDNLKAIFSGAFEAIRVVIETWVKVGTELWERFGKHIVQFAKDSWENIARFIEAITRIIKGILDVFVGVFTGDWSRLWEGVKAIVSGVWEAIKALIGQAINAVSFIIGGVMAGISAAWSLAWNAIKTFLSDIWENIKRGVGAGLEAILTFFKELPGKVLDTIKELPGRMLAFGKEVLGQLAEGFKEFDLWGAIKGIFDGLMDRVLDFFGIASPSKVFHALGKNIAEGLANGIKADAGKVRQAANTLYEASGAANAHRAATQATSGGLNPEFLKRFQAWNASLGGILRIVSGYRSNAEQAILYDRYKRGEGPVAAPPGQSKHNKGLAIDHAPHSWALAKTAKAFRLHHPVGSESWHVEPFAKGGLVTRPTIGMVGEAGPEAIIPLRELASNGLFGGRVGNPGESIVGGPLSRTLELIAEALALMVERFTGWRETSVELVDAGIGELVASVEEGTQKVADTSGKFLTALGSQVKEAEALLSSIRSSAGGSGGGAAAGPVGGSGGEPSPVDADEPLRGKALREARKRLEAEGERFKALVGDVHPAEVEAGRLTRTEADRREAELHRHLMDLREAVMRNGVTINQTINGQTPEQVTRATKRGLRQAAMEWQVQ